MSAPDAPRSVLVTGASGLIGRQVMARLAAERGGIERLVALDVRPPSEAERHAGVVYEQGDVRDPALGKLLEAHAADTIVHLAAVVTPGPGSTPELEYAIDVLGSENVVRCALAAGARQLVYTSSGAAYGYHADSPLPLDEDDALRGNDEFPYSRHKRLVEELLARTRAEHPELLQLVFRPGAILGETVRNPITAIFERPLVIGVRGSDAPFTFVWDEDVARCIEIGIRERRTGIYNLAGDGWLTLPEIARRLGKPYLPLPAPLLAGALGLLRRLGVTRLGREQVRFLRHRPVLSNRRLREEFGFTPSLTSEACFERYRRLHTGG